MAQPEPCAERLKLSNAIVRATAAVYTAKRAADADKELLPALVSARAAEMKAMKELDQHSKEHGCRA
jgi:hypothetical protein